MKGKGYRFWLQGLAAAVLNGAIGGVLSALADPVHFNLHDGWPHLKNLALLSAIIGAANYLKQAPRADDAALTVNVRALGGGR